MKKIKLDKEEQKILADMDKGHYEPMPRMSSFNKKVQVSARNTNASRAISIRLPERDIARLKMKAAAEGLPYQTLIRSVLHKYTESF